MSILNNFGFEYTVARKSKRKGSKKANPFLLLLMAVIFIALGGCGCYFFLYLPLQKVMQSSSWVTTPATVVKSQLATKSSTQRQRSRIDRRDYSIHIDFQYTYKGKSYIGKRYDFFRSLDKYSNGGEEAMQEVVNRHPVGTEITCLVNPENPSESVISREIYFPMLIIVFIPLLFFTVGFIVLIFAIKNIFQTVKGVKKYEN